MISSFSIGLGASLVFIPTSDEAKVVSGVRFNAIHTDLLAELFARCLVIPDITQHYRHPNRIGGQSEHHVNKSMNHVYVFVILTS